MDGAALNQAEDQAFRALLELALAEDLGTQGDITSRAIFHGQTAKARIISREPARLSGVRLAAAVFNRVDQGIKVQSLVADGDQVEGDREILRLEGPVGSILEAERTALNFLGYLSGIASQAALYSTLAARAGRTVVLDTRKTLPGWRLLAKAAVRHGGGQNHRLGLHDMVMIKNNHIDAAGGIDPAVDQVRRVWGDRYRIEVECRNLQEVAQALDARADIIMLDNMEPGLCTQALQLRAAHPFAQGCLLEASGDMDLERIRRFVGLGLDFISVGRITHSVANRNFSLRIGWGG